jgi:hypothetical protein
MSKSGLGTPIARYTRKELTWKDFRRVFLPLLLIVLAPLGYGFWRTLYGYSNYGPAAAAVWGRNWFFAGAILTVVLLFFTLGRLNKAHTWVEVFQWGLYFHFPAGRKKIIPWEDILGITSYSVNRSFLGFKTKTTHHLVLYTRKQSSVSCHPDLKDREGLKKIIKKKVYSILRPELIKAFKSGEVLPFGAVAVSRKMIILPKQEIPWEYVEGLRVQKGYFIIRYSGQKQIEIPIRKIINLEILLHLIKTEI